MTKPRTIIVTGAGSGIGEATARRFSKDGENVVLMGRTRDKLERVAKDLPKERTLVVDGDVAKPQDTDALVKAAVEAFGGVDVVVNNAGVAATGGLEDLSDENFDKMIAINLGGARNVSKAALGRLKKAKGAIVNVSSVSGLGGDWNFYGYNASKGAVANLTRALALDLASEGMRVNAVAPSLTDTDMAQGVTGNEDVMNEFKKRLPMGRPADPSEVASAIVFLAGPDAAFVNGVVLPVDGGLSASNGQPNLNA